MISCYSEVETKEEDFTDLNLLPSAFTVAEGKQVQFAKGNLYWDGSEFGIEEIQFVYTTIRDSGHVDRFYYSNDASVACAETHSASGVSESDILFTNETEDTANPDFTVSGVKGKYRSLSKEEWTYLLNTRTVNSGTREGFSFQIATVNEINGLIIYPDAYTAQSGETEYTDTEWSTMEESGCVFLPAAGYYNSSVLQNENSRGYVWTASPSNESSAYDMSFGNSILVDSNTRVDGKSIRLVVDVQN